MNDTLSKLLLILIFLGATAFGHERTNIDNISVLFGGDPEPMIDHERQNLVWQFTEVDTSELITDLEELEAVVTYQGKEAGSYMARGSSRNPGVYRTAHIFTVPGEGEVTLTFKREGSDKVYSVTFSFSVSSRKILEIPR